MVIEPCVVQFWSEIILVISAQIALHSVQLPLFIIRLGRHDYDEAAVKISQKLTIQ